MDKLKRILICLGVIGAILSTSIESQAKEIKKVDKVESMQKAKQIYKVEKLTITKKSHVDVKSVDSVSNLNKSDKPKDEKTVQQKPLSKKYDVKEIEKELADNRKARKEFEEKEKEREREKEREKDEKENNQSEKSSNKNQDDVKTEEQSIQDWINPLPNMTISSGFGWREDPTGYSGNGHDGIDVPANFGEGVKVVKSGEIVDTGFDSSAGNYIIVSHDNGMFSYYLHLSEQLVSQGQQVSQGNTIGLVGSTGNSTGAHLHFGLAYTSQWREFIDPTNVLPL